MAMGTNNSESEANNLARWTDEQELALLNAIVRCKPVGLHKHFRMLAIYDSLLSSGVVNPDTDTHANIPGIWAKLNSLYDLEKLDEREDAVFADGVDENGNVGAEYWRDFELPLDDGDFEAKMWERRLAPDGSQSPDPEARGRRESTVMDSEGDPRSSPIGDQSSARGSVSRGTRSGRRTAAVGGRVAEIKDDAAKQEGSAGGRSSRRTSKAATPADNEDHEMPDADQVGEEEDGSDDGDEGSELEETEDDKTGGSTTKGSRTNKRGRPRRGRRRG